MPKSSPKAHIRYQNIKKPPTPDVRHRRHRSRGRRTYVGVRAWLYDAFTVNETFPPGRRMTNARIEALLIDEFPDRAQLIAGLKNPDCSTSMQLFRHMYNKGTLCKGLRPVYLSVRYNQAGVAVDGHGHTPLTKPSYLALLNKYGLEFQRHANHSLYERLPDVAS